jgi:hypothetical protein
MFDPDPDPTRAGPPDDLDSSLPDALQDYVTGCLWAVAVLGKAHPAGVR